MAAGDTLGIMEVGEHQVFVVVAVIIQGASFIHAIHFDYFIWVYLDWLSSKRLAQKPLTITLNEHALS